MARLFGTDGVRGLANRDITAELAVDLAVAAAHVLAERGEFSGHRPRAVIGRDTRISGEFLSAAVAELAGRTQHVSGRHREVERELCGQVAVGETSNSVGTERACHQVIPSSCHDLVTHDPCVRTHRL